MRSRAAAVALAASLLTSAGALLPARATSAEACVGVIVDARLAGGQLSTGCALGDPESGLDALTEAGYSYAFPPRYPGLVCSIDGIPDCAETTTTDHWSYWYRERGSRAWVYSSVGAGARDPAPGSTEAWVWQDGGRRQPPDIALAALDTHEAQPSTRAPTRSAKPSPTSTPARNVSTDRPEDQAKVADTAKDSRAARTRGPGRSSTSPATSDPAGSSSSTPTSAGPAPTPSPSAEPTAALPAGDEDGGSPVAGPVAGAALVALLAGAAVWRSRRPTDRP